MKNILKNKIFWIILGITLMGAVLRAYHFSDWMHYQLDQARDYQIIHAAIEYGPGELPLQGPRAAGSFLRLGPLLYYLEYGSALVFGDTPAGSVMIILLLNILAIPLFFIFLRRFFDWKLSVGLTGIFSVSLFMIVYSRFGWNPTLIPFFMILSAYGLLRVTDSDEKSGWWLVVSAGALAFIANMHFIALVIVPVIMVAYLIWTRPKIEFKWWLWAFSLFVFLNVPLIVNDVKTGGENLQEFMNVAFNRSGGSEEDTHSILDKVVRNVGAHTKYYWLILTGDQLATLPELKGMDIKCDYGCRNGMMRGGIASVMMLIGLIGLVWLYRTETHVRKRNFLKLVIVWSVGVFGIYVPLAYDIAPRFFLLNAPLVFIFFGFLIKILFAKDNRILSMIAMFIIVYAMLSNIIFDFRYFNELSRANEDVNLTLEHGDKILKEKTRVTFGQMMKIIDWMELKYKENGEPIFMQEQPEYKRAFGERMDVREIPRGHIAKDSDPLYAQGNYFIIIRTQSDQKSFLENFLTCLNIVETKNFGTLTGYYFEPKQECITDELKVFHKKSRDPKFSKDVQPRYLWRQVFDGCTYNKKTDRCEKDF